MKPRKRKRPKGIRRRVLADGTEVFDPLVKVDGKQKSLGVCSTEAAAVELRHAHFKALASDGQRVPRDTGLLTVRQLGELCPMKEWDIDRWRARVLEMAEFADWPATQVTSEHVQVWIDQMANTPIATGRGKGELPTRGTLHSAISLLRRVYRWARMPARRHVTHNPVEGVTIGNSTDVKPKSRRNVLDYLRENEVKQLLDATRETLPLEPRTKFIVAVFSGARPSDIWRLEWPRIDWSAESIRFTSAKTSMEEESDYTVHALPQLMAALREWWMACGRPEAGLVFPSDDGARYTRGYDAGWSDKRERRGGDSVIVTPGYRSKVGIRRGVPLYALRHTAASHLLLGSELFTGGRMWSREEVQAQLGHKDSKATEFYMRSLGILGRRAAKESKEALRRVKKGDGR